MGNCCKKSKQSESEDSFDLKSAINGKKRICIWILGGPGSGKGTQCERLADRFNLAHLSTGDLLRKVCKEDTPLAQQFKQAMERGELVDTQALLQLLISAMKDAYKNFNGYLIDGFPREVEQGYLFSETIGMPHVIVSLEVPDDILVERLLKRGQDSGRSDDNEETILLRLRTFHNISQPVIDQWREKVVVIDGNRAADEVTQMCIEAILRLGSDFGLK
ncbi:Adenylate kinase isoenzyme 1 [Orchesella cincta]|uniref:Adenylate kinase isoenzyme 1 n=1 Tax=Orchesella cincta TaxID=48709 RepID=A0A1D2NHP1_ORCCI|nr:Adenylate kinase isoenzyme 1 [Orchesella cincta]